MIIAFVWLLMMTNGDEEAQEYTRGTAKAINGMTEVRRVLNQRRRNSKEETIQGTRN